MRPNSEDREPGRCREAGFVGTDAVDVAEEPGELDGEGNPEVGVDGSGTVCNGHGLRDEAGASRHLSMEGCGRSQEAVRELVRVGPGDEGTNRGVARTDGPCRSDDRNNLNKKISFNKVAKIAANIASDVWISSHTVIIRGVKFWEKSIVGAGVIVNRVIIMFSIVAAKLSKN